MNVETAPHPRSLKFVLAELIHPFLHRDEEAEVKSDLPKGGRARPLGLKSELFSLLRECCLKQLVWEEVLRRKKGICLIGWVNFS